MKELLIRWLASCLVPRRKHVVCHVVFIVFPPVVLALEKLDAMLRALDGIGVGPIVRIHELDAVVDGAVRVTLRTEIVVRIPGIGDDRSAGFNPVTYDGHQCVGRSVLYGNKRYFAGLSFNTAKHPLKLNRVSPVIFLPIELALVNFDGLVRTTDLNRAALQKHQHGFPVEHAQFCDCMCTQAIFFLDLVGWFAAHDVVHDE